MGGCTEILARDMDREKVGNWSGDTSTCPGIHSVLKTTEEKAPASVKPGCPGQT